MPTSAPPSTPLHQRLRTYAVRHPGVVLLWAMVGVLLWVQWPMLKGTYYRISGAPPPADGIAWRSDLNAAVAEAAQSGKPLLLSFTASWCPPCHVMKYDVWPDARVGQLISERYVPVRIDVDDAQYADLVGHYAADGIPTILLMDADGRVLAREGFVSARSMMRFLRRDGSTPSPR